LDTKVIIWKSLKLPLSNSGLVDKELHEI
jgi:hypothetical protein